MQDKIPMADRIKVLYKPVGKPFEVREIPNTLEACQELVGGYIEPVTICTDLVLVCNEEGRLLRRGWEGKLAQQLPDAGQRIL